MHLNVIIKNVITQILYFFYTASCTVHSTVRLVLSGTNALTKANGKARVKFRLSKMRLLIQCIFRNRFYFTVIPICRCSFFSFCLYLALSPVIFGWCVYFLDISMSVVTMRDIGFQYRNTIFVHFN